MNSFKLILTTILSGFIIVLSTNAQETSEDLDGSAFMDILIKQLIEDMPKDDKVYQPTSFRDNFISHLDELIDPDIVYDPSYRRLDNMCDDVPADVGVCSDVVIRAFHKIDVCLAEYVYAYRYTKGLPIDTNIDHRRVRNLGAMFRNQDMSVKYKGELTPIYKGDIIWFKMPGNLDHIAIAMEDGVQYTHPPKVLHNIGYGQVVDKQPWAYEVYEIYRVPDTIE